MKLEKKTGSELQQLFDGMTKQGQQALLDYAAYLQQRYPAEQSSHEPQLIPRPAEESVVAAIKRLGKTYPMLDRQALLHETSTFMMQHMMQGREAQLVIDDLEVYFQGQYEAYRQRHS